MTNSGSGARRWISRLLVIGLFGWILGFGVLAWMRATSVPEDMRTVVSPFAPIDGVWEGEYETFDAKGGPAAVRHVRAEFRHVLPGFKLRDRGAIEFRQEGHSIMTDPETGATGIERSLKVHEKESGLFTRKVIRNNGRDKTEFVGREEAGVLVWSRESPGVSETWHERIEDGEYRLDGSGTYEDGNTSATITFRARYRRVAESDAEGG